MNELNDLWVAVLLSPSPMLRRSSQGLTLQPNQSCSTSKLVENGRKVVLVTVYFPSCPCPLLAPPPYLQSMPYPYRRLVLFKLRHKIRRIAYVRRII